MIHLVVAALMGFCPADTFPTYRGFVEVVVDDAGTGRLRFCGPDGSVIRVVQRPLMRSPQVSADGMAFAYLSGDRLEVVDCEGRAVGSYPAGNPYAVGPGGAVAVARGRAIDIHAGRRMHAVSLAGVVVGLGWRHDLLVATGRTAFRIEGDRGVPVHEVEKHERITWLGDTPRGIECLIRGADAHAAWRALGRWDGRTVQRDPPHPVPLPPAKPMGRGVPWPFLPDTLPPIGNSYGEFQNYGGTPYRHPGVDLMGSHYEPVYAVAPGVVKAVLTTSGSYHWRVAVGDSAGPAESQGWLYAHLDLPTIAVSLGDTVSQGAYLGGLVPWPVADFTHLHFTRISASGLTWDGQWLSTGNPLLLADDAEESDAPFFQSANGALLAFCRDNTSEYLPPDSLTGDVDIIAHVGDRIKSPWVVCAHELRYEIRPQGQPFPVVPDRCAVFFDHEIDVYQGGLVDQLLVPVLWKRDVVCPTAGDYDAREFYHILSNSDGDSIPEVSDEDCAFNTALLPDGAYVIKVTARDGARTTVTDSMTVTLANGNPPLGLRCARSGDDLLLSWRRMGGATGYLVYQIPAAYCAQEGTLLAVVADTCFLVPEAFTTGSEGYYRVAATDARGRFGCVSPASNTAAP